jgi:crotonobetainyl-CoA:carnitine CoA-transferase CaiB-like acyl-CoA transferase
MTQTISQGERQVTGATPRPLDGIRVLDLGQLLAVPFCTQMMAWMGADVIVIETTHRNATRILPPHALGVEDPNTSAVFNLQNGNKRSATINLGTQQGRELVLRLVRTADVLIDNFATGVMEKLGLGYDVVRAVQPDIIMLSLGAFGRTGPLKGAVGLHSIVNAFSGLADVTGYAGGPPRLLGGSVPDPLSGAYSLFALEAAIHHRNLTGHGQYIDVAMYEAMLTLIPEAILDISMNDRDPVRVGSRDAVKVPHNVYRCSGDDAWVAISVGTDEEWRALTNAAGHPEWAEDPRFATAAARRANEDALDAAIGEWTAPLTPWEAAEPLQNAGVMAGPVLKANEVLSDAQLVERGFIIEIDHPIAGRRRQISVPWRSDTLPAPAYRHAPLLGAHTREVLGGILGVDDAEWDTLSAAGVLE